MSSDPGRALDALLRLWPFRSVYIADLDAIAAVSDRLSMQRLGGPGRPELWVDSGIDDADMALASLDQAAGCVVLGSESQRDPSCLEALRGHERVLLSLDFRGGRFLGPERLWRDADLWPARVIVMTLDRVGEGRGPDLARVSDVIGRAAGRLVYAAGGVRDVADLDELAAVGSAGALVATALHTGALGPDEIARHDPAGRRP